MAPKIHKLFGPPGTGKTTRLLQILDYELKSYPAEQIAYVSFTRAGANEGKLRAQKIFDLKRKNMEYFRTLHSLGFKLLGLSKGEILSNINKSFIKHKFELTGNSYSHDDQNTDQKYLFCEQLLRANPEKGLELLHTMDRGRFITVANRYRAFKKANGYIDFTDILEKTRDSGIHAPVKIAFIDEAQDLTPLQWDVAHSVFAGCERIYVAGDDDQAIYEWAGSTPVDFLTLTGEKEVLGQSYRLPKKIHRYANSVLERIEYRETKIFSPRDEDGSVDFVHRLEDVKVQENETTLILARARTDLRRIRDLLLQWGIPFKMLGDEYPNDRDMRYIRMFNHAKENPENIAAQKLLESAVTVGGLYTPYTDKIDVMDAVAFQERDTPAIKVFYREFLKNCNNEKKFDVTLSTIHAAKGKEADHVVVLLNLTKRVEDVYYRSRDEEMRCLYVACTRAKQRMTIVEGGKRSYPNFMQELL